MIACTTHKWVEVMFDRLDPKDQWEDVVGYSTRWCESCGAICEGIHTKGGEIIEAEDSLRIPFNSGGDGYDQETDEPPVEVIDNDIDADFFR